MPPKAPEPSLFSICFKVTLPEKIAASEKNVEIWCFLPGKFSESATNIKPSFEELTYTFLGFNVFVFT